MRKIELDDILRYRIPSRLTYSPSGRYLAFQVTEADREKNMYHTSVWIAEDGDARRMTFSLDASIAFWEDEETLILRRKSLEAPAEGTELFRLDMRGGEAEPWMTLPFSMTGMKKLGEN